MNAAGPLDGIKVIEIGVAIASPFCAMMIDDCGAEVVQIERAGAGDDSRAWPQCGTRSALGDGRWQLQSRFKDPVVAGRNGEAAPSESLPRSGAGGVEPPEGFG